MAHMWFGDLVTMTWWDDLWLNESFATFASVLALTRATRFTNGWTAFANDEKTWAYQQDQLPTTHPITADMPDTNSVHNNFDGITYAKGASVLRQLAAWVGEDAFLEGLRIYFRRHEFSNTDLSGFLSALEEASDRDLHAWSKEWLETAGLNTLRPAIETGGDSITSFAIEQQAPPEQPVLRSHRLGIGLYDLDGGELKRRRFLETDVLGSRTQIPDLEGEPMADLVLPNDDDLAYAKIRLDARSLQTAIDSLGRLRDPLSRTLCWSAYWDMVRDAEAPTRDYLQLVLRNAQAEDDVGVVQRLLGQVTAAIDLYGDPSNRTAAHEALAAGTREVANGAEPGSDLQLAWTRAFIGTATTAEHLDEVRGILTGETEVEGLTVDVDLRWHIVISLASVGAVGGEVIAAELERDATDAGRRHAATARAARREPGAKAEAWRSITEDATLSVATLSALMRGFQQPGQRELLEPYAPRYFEALDPIWNDRDFEVALAFAGGMYPRLRVDESTVALTESHLDSNDVPGPITRILVEAMDGVRRALRAREADRAAA
jgi:aminopeptidase N